MKTRDAWEAEDQELVRGGEKKLKAEDKAGGI